LLLLAASSGCSKLRARDQLNKGVTAFTNSQFQSATLHFKNAVALDPTLLNARLYLATAYKLQYIPGGESRKTRRSPTGDRCFRGCPEDGSNNTTAIASVGEMYYNMRKFEKAKDYQRHWVQVEPNNPVPYYWLGMLDWAIVFPRTQQLRKDLKIEFPKDPKNPAACRLFPKRPARSWKIKTVRSSRKGWRFWRRLFSSSQTTPMRWLT